MMVMVIHGIPHGYCKRLATNILQNGSPGSATATSFKVMGFAKLWASSTIVNSQSTPMLRASKRNQLLGQLQSWELRPPVSSWTPTLCK